MDRKEMEEEAKKRIIIRNMQKQVPVGIAS